MKTKTITAKLRDAVPLRLFDGENERHCYKNIELPEQFKELVLEDFAFDIAEKITFKLIYKKGTLPQHSKDFPPPRAKVTREDKRAAKVKAEIEAAQNKKVAQESSSNEPKAMDIGKQPEVKVADAPPKEVVSKTSDLKTPTPTPAGKPSDVKKGNAEEQKPAVKDSKVTSVDKKAEDNKKPDASAPSPAVKNAPASKGAGAIDKAKAAELIKGALNKTPIPVTNVSAPKNNKK